MGRRTSPFEGCFAAIFGGKYRLDEKWALTGQLLFGSKPAVNVALTYDLKR